MPYKDIQKRRQKTREYRQTQQYRAYLERTRAERSVRRKAYRAANRERLNALTKWWRQRNPEKVKAYKAKWNTENHDKVLKHKKALRNRQGEALRAKMRVYLKEIPQGHTLTRAQIYKRRQYYKNPEKYRAKTRDWQRNNPEKVNAWHRERYHRDPKFREIIKRRLRNWRPHSPRKRVIKAKWSLCDGICYICGSRVEWQRVTVDHVIPANRGGSENFSNLMPVHGVCNSRKADKLDFPVVRPELVVLCRAVGGES